jgi:hypothetical protein
MVMRNTMNLKKRKNFFNQNQFDDECMEDLVQQNAWL